MPSYKPATLTLHELGLLQALERELSTGKLVVVLERHKETYTIEAKGENGFWQPLSSVIPGLALQRSQFRTRSEALEAKAEIKTLLRNTPDKRKAPIRIRPLDWTLPAKE